MVFTSSCSFVVGVIIKVPADHPMIKTDGVGIRMSVDISTLEYSLRIFLKFLFMWAMLIIAVISAGFLLYKRYVKKDASTIENKLGFYAKLTGSLALLVISIISIATNNSLMTVKKVPGSHRFAYCFAWLIQ